jgi:hypothetical protein
MGTLQEALAELIKPKGPKAPAKDKTIEEEREMARQMSKALPKQVFPHEALAKKKKQLADLDEQTKE